MDELTKHSEHLSQGSWSDSRFELVSLRNEAWGGVAVKSLPY